MKTKQYLFFLLSSFIHVNLSSDLIYIAVMYEISNCETANVRVLINILHIVHYF